MAPRGWDKEPAHGSYDVVIVGGAMYGAAISWFLVSNPDFDGRVLVVERDPMYRFASTTHTNTCIRQQYSQELNIRISQFGASYIKSFREQLGGDERVPDILLHSFGYLYLADTPEFATHLKEVQALQASCGAGTRHMSHDEIAAAYVLDPSVESEGDDLYVDYNTQFGPGYGDTLSWREHYQPGLGEQKAHVVRAIDAQKLEAMMVEAMAEGNTAAR